ncbi:hypothetical protein [Salinarimonas ramus]|uniref:Uncharacterized protein n=1 Tax=Salinarimonas ramus TaxID=690164 RepID=A0A917Q6E6_9HYPH|nr:hypothetical protein [Salinarimonas ramus]GGK30602.1 hypothetical protein GCM10011322_16420 [Salinarimonas ramus]
MRKTIPAETTMKSALLALAGALAITFAAPAIAADYARGDIAEERLGGWYYGAPPAEERVSPFAGTVPSCDAPTILSTISGEFNRREARFWNSGLRIVGIEHVRPVAFRPWGDSFIPRRFCTATAAVQRGPVVRHHRVNYLIREELGVFLQSSHDVEWCVIGVERLLHAAPNCEMMLP